MNNDQIFRRFCYANGCLKNKLNIHNTAQLATKEYQTVCKQIQIILSQPPKINSLDDLCTVHRKLFGSIYPWAGHVRTDYDLSKRTNGIDFYTQPASTIPLAWQYIEHELLQPIIKNVKPSIEEYMKLMDNINTLHPFREGNGRSCKTFLQLIALQHHQYLHFPRHQKQLIIAMNAANYQQMAQVVQLCDSKKPIVQQLDTEAPFNDIQHTIYNYYFADRNTYRIARDSVLFNLYEGWQPNAKEVSAILKNKK